MKDDLVQGALEALMPLEFYERTPEEFEKYWLQALAEVDGLARAWPISSRPSASAAWDRRAVRVEVGKPDPMTTLRIEPLDGDPVVRLAGPSSADDPWSLAVKALLDPSPTSVQAA